MNKIRLMERKTNSSFDFSLDAQDFKARLGQQLKLMARQIEPMEDDDLEWVNAAGVPQRNPDDLPL